MVGNLIYNYKLQLKMGPRQTAEPPHGGKASLEFMIILCVKEAELGDKREPSSRKLIRSHEGGFNKQFEIKITCYYERVETTEMSRTTKPSNLIYTFLSTLALRQCQMRQSRQGVVGHAL